MANWDVIVLGLGGVGSAAAYHLASSKCRVLGLDQFAPVHDRGSSHGATRVIRQAYFEHPSYVPLLRRAYSLWGDLERTSDAHLFHRTGLVEIGPADGAVISGVKRSAVEHDLKIQELSMGEVTAMWPGLSGDENWQAVVEQDAGFLMVEECVAAHLRLAAEAGAVCRHHQQVRRWEVGNDGVRIFTDGGTESADRLVIAAGPWIDSAIHGLGSGPGLATGRGLGSGGQLGFKPDVLRKHLYWLRADAAGYELADGFPCFFYDTPSGYYYGFPSIDGSGVKVSRHSGGELIDGPGGVHLQDETDRRSVNRFVGHCLPGVSDQLLSHAGCYYTMTPDGHFIVDVLPGQDAVIVIGGLSGHGFKFTSVLGEIACQLAMGVPPAMDLSLFRLARFH